MEPHPLYWCRPHSVGDHAAQLGKPGQAGSVAASGSQIGCLRDELGGTRFATHDGELAAGQASLVAPERRAGDQCLVDVLCRLVEPAEAP